jgi:tRNA/rRNA methyltransferase
MTSPSLPSFASESGALSSVRVVLVHTSHPGNIGAAARAMKTMGLEALYLVDPKRAPDAESVAMASRATDVLERATLCASLDEALRGTVYAVASTARARDLSHEVVTPREAAARLLREVTRGPVAIVFGPEKYGLTAADVSKCNLIACIPASPGYSSLNLAAAVQVFAYELRVAADSGVPLVRGESEPAAYEDVERLYAHLEQTLYEIGFLDPKQPKRLVQRLRRLFTRARLEKEEVNILRGILAAAQSHAKKS